MGGYYKWSCYGHLYTQDIKDFAWLLGISATTLCCLLFGTILPQSSTPPKILDFDKEDCFESELVFPALKLGQVKGLGSSLTFIVSSSVLGALCVFLHLILRMTLAEVVPCSYFMV